MSSTAQFKDLESWLLALTQPAALTELSLVVACGLGAWLISTVAWKALGWQDRNSILFGRRVLDGALFPALQLLLAYLAQAILVRYMPLAVFKLVIPVLLALLVIRVGVKVLQAAFDDTPLIRLLERTISWLVWIAMVLWVSGLLPLVLDELDQIKWKVGGTSLSVRSLIEGTLTAVAVLFVTLWISSAIESRLLRNTSGGELSLRKAMSNATRVLLMFVGLLMALSVVGIDLTALSVLGGAIGVGVGFGLQKLAANYVSGFVILAERSMRIGDNVRVDNFEGIITQINARSTVIRSLAGRESIVPNEMLIISRVENLSLADSRVWQSTTVSVAYDTNVDHAMALIKQAALAQARVLREPVPSVGLTSFGADGLELRVGYWIGDPENGADNLRSLINLDILRALREHRIEIPFPQRVVHVQTSQS